MSQSSKEQASKRTERIAEMIQRKLSQIILQEIKDPRIPSFVTISGVTVSRDLSYAKVYFTALNANAKEATHVLNQASGFLRSALSRTSTVRTVPQLQFIYDKSIEYGEHLSRLIDEANEANNSQDTHDEKPD